METVTLFRTSLAPRSYNRVGTTKTVQTFSLLSSLILRRSQTFPRSLPNATLALTILVATSSAMGTARYVNLSRTCSLCPFAVKVGSFYGFPAIVWYTAAFLCRILDHSPHRLVKCLAFSFLLRHSLQCNSVEKI